MKERLQQSTIQQTQLPSLSLDHIRHDVGGDIDLNADDFVVAPLLLKLFSQDSG